jgi:hypothetical protein
LHFGFETASENAARTPRRLIAADDADPNLRLRAAIELLRREDEERRRASLWPFPAKNPAGD